MMFARVCLAVTALAAPGQGALAADVAVRTGEHPGFTRLVVEDPAIRGWQVGRTEEGYVLRLSPAAEGFDISNAFRLIGRERLTSLRATSSGELHLGVGCACHIQPAEIRDGVITLDIHDGPAAPGSAYERPLPPPGVPAIAQIRPRARPVSDAAPYDWQTVQQPRSGADLHLGMNAPALEAMRQSLVEQLSRGAAAGSVDFASVAPAPSATEPAAAPNVRVLPAPGFDPAAGDRPERHLTGEGSDCIPDDRLDVTSWGDETPVAEQMSQALAGLTGEFDDPQPHAVAKAVRFYISLGFGAEARQMLGAFRTADPDRPLWDAMARVLDGERLAGSALADMATCDTAAALWSVLADPPSGGRSINASAVLRAFSALPPHLRRHLGPRLAADFLAQADTASARAVQDAILRAPGDPGGATHVADARLAVAEGRPVPREELARMSGRTGPEGADALVMLVEEKISAGEAPSTEQVVALASLLREHQGSATGARLGHAYRLASAAVGDFETAFARRDLAPEADAGVWKLLSEGPDSEVLSRAVLRENAALPDVSGATRRQLARRLLDLGLAEEARRWIAGASDDEPEDRLIRARIAYHERNPAKALTELAGLSGPEAEELRAAAREGLPDRPLRNDAAGQPPAPTDSALGSQTQQTQSPFPEPPRAVPEDAAMAGPLARSRALVEQSAAERSRIEALLRTAGQ